jgi:hypothetical protein
MKNKQELTSIELLAVIAINALLLSIELSFLRKAKDAPAGAVCQSNLPQMRRI